MWSCKQCLPFVLPTLIALTALQIFLFVTNHKNDLIEDLAVTFTDMLQDIQQAIDICAERLDTEAVASMLSSIYTQVNIN